jgi:hypothetical protein
LLRFERGLDGKCGSRGSGVSTLDGFVDFRAALRMRITVSMG